MSRKKKAKAQAGEVTYELHSLGWKGFQDLCATITAEIWGQTVQGFFDSQDGGRDGAFYGTWQPKGGESYKGSFAIQCKYTSAADKQIRPSDLADELTKAKRLGAKGLADNYFLFTNAHLKGTTSEKLTEMFQAVSGIKRFAAFGSESISRFIRESSRLRMLVPRVYGLGDLGQIFDERAYDQAREILSALGEDLARFVITDPFKRSAQALVEHGFVLLLGEPTCGKSTIAAALAVGALDEWGCSTVKIRDADDFVKHSNPHEPKQFFWIDDAFGTTQIDSSITTGWNRVFPHINAAIRRGARIVFTSRDYIYSSALKYLKESALPVMKESKVVIRVQDLTRDEREQILYNHIRLGTQPKKMKSRLKGLLPAVATHQNFTPEIARRLGNPAFTKNMLLSRDGLDDFVSRPLGLLCEIIKTLDAESRSALALVFLRGGVLPSPIRMSDEETRAIGLFGGTVSGIRDAINALSGSLVVQSIQGGSYTWRFKHPTIRDAFASLIAEDRELMDIYLAGAPIERLFQEVSCGDVGIEGVKVIIPSDRYDALLSRIEAYRTMAQNKGALYWFLSHRCARDFLVQYIARYPEFIRNLRVGSYFYAVSDIGVIVRLNEYGLLPEKYRQSIIGEIKDLAVSTPDAGFLKKRMRGLFSQEEIDDILNHVQEELLPKLDGVISDWKSSIGVDDSPEGYFDELTGALRDYQEEFDNDSEAVALIETALVRIEEVIDELEYELPEGFDPEVPFGQAVNREEHSVGRSIFDDVDD